MKHKVRRAEYEEDLVGKAQWQARSTRRPLILALLICAVCGLHSPTLGEADWRSDELMPAIVTLPQKTITLKEACAELGRQTSSEFYIDRRLADTKIAWHAGDMQLGTAMGVIESVSGFEWRTVGNLFFLSPDARGAAVTRWYERYAAAEKAHLAGITESRVKEWVYYMMPFPPKVDPPWQLTPLQREQLAYSRSLLLFTMTPPQLGWLGAALSTRNYHTAEGRTVIDQMAADLFEVPLKFSAAMVIHAPSGDFLVEMPLSPEQRVPKEPSPRKPAKTEPASPEPAKEEPKKIALKGEMKALWVMGGDLREVPDLLKKAESKGFNAVFLPALRCGHTIYPSKKFPREPAYKDADVLKETIKAAADLGLSVHAVLEATLWADAEHPAPPAAADYPLVHERNLLARTYGEQEKWQRAELRALEPDIQPAANEPPAPEEKRVYLCPASSQVPRLLRSAVEEIAADYKVAGICLDGVDYPSSTPFVLAGEDLSPPFGYTLEVRREMIRLHQIDPIDVDASGVRTEGDAEAFALWDTFRRGRLTGLVEEVCAAFKRARPDGICSVALDLASDAPSPAHWSKIGALDALVPFVEIRRPEGEEEFTYPEEEGEAVASLHRALLKNAAVIPAVAGLEADSLADEVTALADFTKLAKDSGLKGYILRGDVQSLASAVEALGE